MTLLLTHEDVCAAVTMADAIDAMEHGFAEEATGHTRMPPRINVPAGKGWLRLGPVVLEASGWMGFKAMNLAAGKGVRYQVHLYRIETGELLAIMDAQHMTTLRTGATSAVATKRLARPGMADVALLGAGGEAVAQLEAMAALGLVRSARVFSPTQANREKLAAHFAAQGMAIEAVGSAEEAVRDAGLVLAAVKSPVVALQGDWLAPGTHVNSVGTARHEQRECDVACFIRASRIVVDTKDGVFGEAGDAVAARDAIDMDQVHELSALVAGSVPGRGSDAEITLFKSVGTGLQDIALAAVVYQRAKTLGLGTDIGAFPWLKGG
jgi:alanine dehydrogenase